MSIKWAKNTLTPSILVVEPEFNVKGDKILLSNTHITHSCTQVLESRNQSK